MAFSLISSTQAGSTNGGVSVTTTGINTTGANLLVAVISYFGVTAPTVSDSQGNVWTVIDTRTNTSRNVRILYTFAPTTNASQTVTASLAASFPGVVFAAFSGAATAPLDQVTGTTTNVSGNITPTQANELVISGYASDIMTVPSVTGVTLLGSLAEVTSQSIAVGMGYTIQTAATLVGATWSAGANAASNICSFKAAASASGGPFEPPITANVNGYMSGGFQG